MEHLEGILKLADKELASVIENGKFRSREEIHSVYELMDIAKDAYCIWAYEEEMEGGEDGMSSAGGSYYREGRGGGGRGGSNRGGGSYYEEEAMSVADAAEMPVVTAWAGMPVRVPTVRAVTAMAV